MPVTDRREPGVYVTIEDASYIEPAIEVGRTVFIVGLCDRGPHNRVVEITSQAEFHKKFGQPDFTKCSQSHYVMDKAMQYTGKGMYVRVTPEDSTLSNSFIKENSSSVTVIGAGNEFTFTEFSGTKPSKTDPTYWSGGAYNSGTFDQSTYDADLAAYEASYDAGRIVSVDPSVFDSFSEGDWIYANQTPEGPSEAKQIITKNSDDYTYILHEPYSGAVDGWGTYTVSAAKYVPYISGSDILSWDTSWTSEFDVDTSTVYHFWAIGAGKYYDNLKIKGARNVELEKMYTTENGDVKYKYLFMDIAIYYENDEGNDVLLEGPWQVSLVRRTPDNQIIRNLSSGQVLFIQDVINENSEYIQCVAGNAIQQLSLPASESNNIVSEQNRQQIMLLLSNDTPVGTTNYVPLGNALTFGGGSDGTTDGNPMYNTAGYLYQSDEIWGRVKQAYMGSMTSVDGSIEVLREVTYPWYTPDYIVTGGFPAWVQEGGRYLADYRQDCFHIGDSEFNNRYEQDLEARLNDVPWNNWTSMLYVQYRQRKDEYTGQSMWITPCYHAIERHLAVDAQYFVAEPVAGIEKGAIAEPITLAYRANHTERGDLQEVEMNPTIVEPDGKYFLTQLTTWKRLSILKRAHAAKFTCYVRKMLPPLLKDLLQRKGTPYWIGQAEVRVNSFMNRFVDAPVERYQILDQFTPYIEFDDQASELNVYIRMKPIRVIERINVYLIVE